MSRGVECRDWIFRGGLAIPVTASPDAQPFRKTVVKTAGTPTVAANAAGDALALTLEATSEAQVCALHFGDALAFDLDDLISFEAWVRSTTAAWPADCTCAIGLSGNYNADPDAIAQSAFFRLGAATPASISVGTDDAVTDSGNVAGGSEFGLGTAFRKLAIEFADQLTAGPPAQGGKSRVKFLAQGFSHGAMREVAPATRFDMSGYAGGLQPMIHLAKATGTAAPVLEVQRIRVRFRTND